MGKYYLLLASLSILGLSGCTSSTAKVTPMQNRKVIGNYERPTPYKLSLYNKTMLTVASSIKRDRKYRRIALDTPRKKEWFRVLTYRLWDRQITRNQFMKEGLAHYPKHKYELIFIIKGFEKAFISS